MLPVDRVFCSLSKEMPDMTPCMPILDTYHTPRLLGLKLREAYLDSQKMAKAQLQAYYRYQVDGLEVGLGPSETPENMLGCRVIYPQDDVPIYGEPPIKELEDIDKIPLPEVLNKQLIPIEILSKEVGDKLFIAGVVSAPFEYACILHGFSQTLRDLRLRPGFVNGILERTTEISRIYGEALIRSGAHGIKIKDSVAASTIISPKDYRTFAQPYEKEILGRFKKMGAKTILHICTDSTPILKNMTETGADALEIDYIVDLKFAKALIGSIVCIKGNLAPVQLVLQRRPPEIFRATRDAILSAGVGGGYIVSTGDSIPRDTPSENVLAIVKATRKFGGASSLT